MCTRVYNLDTDVEAESPQELREMFPGTPLVLDKHNQTGEIDEGCCLCQIDVEKTATNAGYQFIHEGGDPMNVHVWKEHGT